MSGLGKEREAYIETSDAKATFAAPLPEKPVPSPMVYLDHAATTPMMPVARAAMEQGFDAWANPSSPHRIGRDARALLEDARARVKSALDWQGEVIFTSGASEALAIGLDRAKVDRRIVSAVEHDAVLRAAPDAAMLPIVKGGQDLEGTPNIDMLGALLAQPGRAVVAIQSINSETGTIIVPYQNGALAEIGRASCRERVLNMV